MALTLLAMKCFEIIINGAVVARLEGFKFLSVDITNKLLSAKHSKTVVKRARQHLFPLRRLKRFWHGSPDLEKVLQLHHQEYADRLHHRLVWQLLGI